MTTQNLIRKMSLCELVRRYLCWPTNQGKTFEKLLFFNLFWKVLVSAVFSLSIKTYIQPLINHISRR
ncbi:hypothetical protein CS542_06840 [Pedobacter sp. IW39]|nr:hypothetical protein CS542_06840 [Pedobacter sp. IW39]